jgi:hypothetical protein
MAKWNSAIDANDAIEVFLKSNNLSWPKNCGSVAEFSRYAISGVNNKKIREIYKLSLSSICVGNQEWSDEQKREFLKIARSGSGIDDSINLSTQSQQSSVQHQQASAQTQQHSKASHEDMKWGWKQRLVQAGVFVAGVGVAIAGLALGTTAGLGGISAALELSHIAPEFKEFNKTLPGRILRSVKSIVLSKPVVKVFKIAMSAIAIAAAANPVGLAIAISGMTLSLVKMAYNTFSAVRQNREFKNLERAAKASNAIEVSERVAGDSIAILKSMGLDVSKDEKNLKSVVTLEEEQGVSAKKTFIHVARESIIESVGSIVRSALSADPIEIAMTSICAVAGVGKETEEHLERVENVNLLKKELAKSGIKTPCDGAKLEKYANAHKVKTEALIALAEEVKNDPSIKEKLQEKYDAIHQRFSDQIAAETPKKSFGTKVLDLIKDIAHVYKPENPLAILKGEDKKEMMEKIEDAKKEEERHYDQIKSKSNALAIGPASQQHQVSVSTPQHQVSTPHDPKVAQEVKSMITTLGTHQVTSTDSTPVVRKSGPEIEIS